MSSLAALATELQVTSAEEADIEKAADAALRRLAEQGNIWLLVYDNVASPEEIAGLLPAAGARGRRQSNGIHRRTGRHARSQATPTRQVRATTPMQSSVSACKPAG
jgi:hypothetical protein